MKCNVISLALTMILNSEYYKVQNQIANTTFKIYEPNRGLVMILRKPVPKLAFQNQPSAWFTSVMGDRDFEEQPEPICLRNA